MASSAKRTTNETMRWIKKYAGKLLDDPSNGIIGVGLGKKSTGPLDDDSEFCVTGFVERKLSKRELKSRAVVEFTSSFAAVSSGPSPASQGYEVDIVEAGSGFAAQPGLRVPKSQRGTYGGPLPTVDLQKRFDSLRAGVGITNPVGTYPSVLSVGTLGFFVAAANGRIYLVSNNHVIAEENGANRNDAIVQPGTLDLTATELSLMRTRPQLERRLKIAKLAAWIDLQFHQPANIPLNEVDCALAEIDAKARGTTELARVGLGGVLRGVASPYKVDSNTGTVTGSTRVFKAGRTTGWTEGNVSALGVFSDVQYTSGVARFHNQLAITATPDNGGSFSDRGDSGSGIVNDDHKLVALLFAGSKTRTLANPIKIVLSNLAAALGTGQLKVVTG